VFRKADKGVPADTVPWEPREFRPVEAPQVADKAGSPSLSKAKGGVVHDRYDHFIVDILLRDSYLYHYHPRYYFILYWLFYINTVCLK